MRAKSDEVFRRALGLTLAELRKEQKITCDSMSERMETDRKVIYYLERGLRDATLPTVAKFAKALDISLSALFELVEKKMETLA